MKLKVLTDNYTYIDQYYLGEPGLSIYIEAEGKKFLLDTGYSDVFLRNAAKMQINLKALDGIIFSHGHNDHTAGLPYLLAEEGLPKQKIIAHPLCFAPKRADGLDIGSPLSREKLASCCMLNLSGSPIHLTEHLVFLGQIPRIVPFENNVIGETLVDGKWVPDSVLDDTALVWQGKDGIFIITGCSHSGICNIVEQAIKVCGDEPIIGIIGGMHLFAVDDKLEQTINYLQSKHVTKLYPCHCVSLMAKAQMINAMPVATVGVNFSKEVE
ncbi:MAG: MBL fold metallo-hydrolase [Acidaminococcaceae bacterium]|jgi:7,8-dihydropterin-6-yl-methyl-4-(beta-D-ribofuranosyl)aminobenzene 5'-phosphate synthase|nr:MBL fold metallo-hydrolase [Acidaminococcaceae bacterium]